MKCPECNSETISTTVCEVCEKCGWKEITKDELSSLQKTIIKNELNRIHTQKERARSNKNVLRSYRIK